MNLENIMLGEINQTQNPTHFIIPFRQAIQNREIYRDRKQRDAWGGSVG